MLDFCLSFIIASFNFSEKALLSLWEKAEGKTRMGHIFISYGYKDAESKVFPVIMSDFCWFDNDKTMNNA